MPKQQDHDHHPPLTRKGSSAASECTLRDHDDNSHSDDIATESTPLLLGKPSAHKVTSDSGPSSSSSSVLERGGEDKDDDDRPLPLAQVLILCFGRVMESVAFFAIFPFIAQMVQRNGQLPDSDIGFYSGLIESLFSLTQTLVLIFWGRLADRVGRKPVLVICLIGMAAGTMAYTMATTIWEMLFFRCIAGVFSGCTLVIRTMISEVSTSKTQAVAFSWFAFFGNIGIFLGPMIGGSLADPVEQFPSIFKGNAFFEKYPYALVGIVITGISIAGIVTCILFLEETLKPEENSSSGDAGKNSVSKKRLSILELLKAPGVGITLVVYSSVMLIAFAYMSIIPVALYTPVSIGGMGFSSFEISIFMTTQGGSQALWLLLVFPVLQRRMGTRKLLRACISAYPIFFISAVAVNFMLRNGSDPAFAIACVIGLIVTIGGPGVSMAFTGVQLAINDVSPNRYALGTLNAIALTVASAVRSFVPGVATAVYAIGVRDQILWGHLAWVILTPSAVILFLGMRWLPADKK